MGEIRIVGPGKTRGYPYPVCKKEEYKIWNNFTKDRNLIIDCFNLYDKEEAN